MPNETTDPALNWAQIAKTGETGGPDAPISELADYTYALTPRECIVFEHQCLRNPPTPQAEVGELVAGLSGGHAISRTRVAQLRKVALVKLRRARQKALNRPTEEAARRAARSQAVPYLPLSPDELAKAKKQLEAMNDTP